MSDQPDLFRSPTRPLPPLPPPFDAYRHPCAVCGAEPAPFGAGWPHDPKFYCRQHLEVAMLAPSKPRNAEVAVIE